MFSNVEGEADPLQLLELSVVEPDFSLQEQ